MEFPHSPCYPLHIPNIPYKIKRGFLEVNSEYPKRIKNSAFLLAVALPTNHQIDILILGLRPSDIKCVVTRRLVNKVSIFPNLSTI